MIDTLGYPIREGDYVIQCASEWGGPQAYQVLREPDETKRIRVKHLWMFPGAEKALVKKSDNFVNVSAIFGDVLDQEEIKRRLTELHVV